MGTSEIKEKRKNLNSIKGNSKLIEFYCFFALNTMNDNNNFSFTECSSLFPLPSLLAEACVQYQYSVLGKISSCLKFS